MTKKEFLELNLDITEYKFDDYDKFIIDRLFEKKDEFILKSTVTEFSLICYFFSNIKAQLNLYSLNITGSMYSLNPDVIKGRLTEWIDHIHNNNNAFNQIIKILKLENISSSLMMQFLKQITFESKDFIFEYLNSIDENIFNRHINSICNSKIYKAISPNILTSAVMVYNNSRTNDEDKLSLFEVFNDIDKYYYVVDEYLK